MNFELRWLKRETGKTLQNEYGFYYPETVRVLQYRTKMIYTDYSIMEHSHTHFGERLIWSEWMDVPVEQEATQTKKTKV